MRSLAEGKLITAVILIAAVSFLISGCKKESDYIKYEYGVFLGE